MTKINAANVEIRREKKRAWDRAAQRTCRQKTKARIAHLQETIQSLQNQTPEDTITRLLERNEELETEVTRLKKVIQSAFSVLSEEASHTKMPTAEHIATPKLLSQAPSLNDYGADTIIPSYERSYSIAGLTETSSVHVGCSPTESCKGRQEIAQYPCFHRQVQLRSALYLMPMPVTSTHNRHPYENPETALSYQSSCSAWYTVNKLLSQAYPSHTSEMFPKIDKIGVLLQAIDRGWETLSPEERINPGLCILQRMDEYIWSPMPKIFRVAIAYKSYQLMRYIFQPGPETRLKIPAWELPTEKQLKEPHACAIDFFPWPSVRDRLITHYSVYLETCTFFSTIQQFFRFHWPHSFEESYSFDGDSGYTPSDLFVQHAADLSNWKMGPQFFHLYPEFIDIVPQADF
ncbi:hypothetical protein N7471_002345 [Penicillium samsonianum]|uniref:uncharacterized protein n=1 Tax=Penicillium samsonianum TaxID=1882272 RepID=UPI002549306F|nr:uncharacterized protein N7471_002345 [Penicillium samsonianum]KAJ6142892.1 hypothetical protein N7471_002345 [Penicillium samsonianum]